MSKATVTHWVESHQASVSEKLWTIWSVNICSHRSSASSKVYLRRPLSLYSGNPGFSGTRRTESLSVSTNKCTTVAPNWLKTMSKEWSSILCGRIWALYKQLWQKLLQLSHQLSEGHHLRSHDTLWAKNLEARTWIHQPRLCVSKPNHQCWGLHPLARNTSN